MYRPFVSTIIAGTGTGLAVAQIGNGDVEWRAVAAAFGTSVGVALCHGICGMIQRFFANRKNAASAHADKNQTKLNI